VAGVITNYLEGPKQKALALGPDKNAGGIMDFEDAFLPLPVTITQSSYENSKRYRNYQIMPIECDGFSRDGAPQYSISDCFKRGWTAYKTGARIAFRVLGPNIAVQYRKTVRRPAPVARLILDGDQSSAITLDSNFTEDWGDCLYLETILEHGSEGEHTIEIEIVQASKEDKEGFYLVSVIAGA